MTNTSDERSGSDRDRFAGYYAAPRAPWGIGRPQRAFIEAGDLIHGRVLDVGCGTGDLALWLAERGCAVTGIDLLGQPLDVARRKAAGRGLTVNFLQMDARAIGEIPERFDTVTDCGLFHVFDDEGRIAYVAALEKLLEPGARLFLLCFSTAEPGTHGPRRVGEDELRRAFAAGWVVESIEPSRFDVVPGIAGAEFTPDGARAWLATIRRA
jgi:2-polyprenyl-3-methyl-5-hydroxy-6-metoxy-1,4-benzoquinol methylase